MQVWMLDTAAASLGGPRDGPPPVFSAGWFMFTFISIALVLVAGTVAGLTMVRSRKFLRFAETFGVSIFDTEYPNTPHHCSQLASIDILRCNAENEALPVMLGRLVPEGVAIVISVTAVLLCGEIIPSAICTGPSQLRIASAMTPVVGFLVVITFPVSYPMAWLLDKWLGDEGDHGTRYRRDELKEFIRLHGGAAVQRVASGDTPASSTFQKRSQRARPSATTTEEEGSLRDSLLLPALDNDVEEAYDTDPLHSRHRTLSLKDVDAAEVGVRAGTVMRDSSDVPGVLVLSKPKRRMEIAPVPGAAYRGRGGRYGSAVEEEGGPESPVPTPMAHRTTWGNSARETARVESTTLLPDEVTMIEGVLEMGRKTVKDVMTPAGRMYALSTKDVMDRETMTDIIESTMSRVPVYAGNDRNKIVGLILVKLLIRLNPDDRTPVSDLTLQLPLVLHPDVSLFEALALFQTGRSHLAIVTEQVQQLKASLRDHQIPPREVRVLGIVTIEDALEQLIKEPIEDELDRMASFGDILRYQSHVLRPQMPDPRFTAMAEGMASNAGGLASGVPGMEATEEERRLHAEPERPERRRFGPDSGKEMEMQSPGRRATGHRQ